MSEQNGAPEGWSGWAIVELFGHKRLAGFVSSQVVGSGALVRIDVPATDADSRPATAEYSKFVGNAAIYGITPVTEEVARRAAREIERWNDPLPISLPQLAAGTSAADVPDDQDDSDWGDDDEGDFR